jgi:hypothetical protein
LIILLFVPLASAGFWDWWNAITGRAAETPTTTIEITSTAQPTIT